MVKIPTVHNLSPQWKCLLCNFKSQSLATSPLLWWPRVEQYRQSPTNAWTAHTESRTISGRLPEHRLGFKYWLRSGSSHRFSQCAASENPGAVHCRMKCSQVMINSPCDWGTWTAHAFTGVKRWSSSIRWCVLDAVVTALQHQVQVRKTEQKGVTRAPLQYSSSTRRKSIWCFYNLKKLRWEYSLVDKRWWRCLRIPFQNVSGVVKIKSFPPVRGSTWHYWLPSGKREKLPGDWVGTGMRDVRFNWELRNIPTYVHMGTLPSHSDSNPFRLRWVFFLFFFFFCFLKVKASHWRQRWWWFTE